MNTCKSIKQDNSISLFWIATYIIALCFVLVVIFLPAVTFGFLAYDESYQIKFNPLVRSLELDNLARIFTSFCIKSYYPIRLLSYAIDYHFWGLNPIGYHLTNLLLHILNTLLVFWLVFRLIGDVETGPDDRAGTGSQLEKKNGYSLMSAAAAACIFGIHPVVVEVAAWVGAREELLMALFALLCIHCWTRARNLRGCTCARRVWLFYLLSVVFCALSCLSNAMGILIPAIIVVYEKTLGSKLSPRNLLGCTWSLWMIAFITFVLKLMGRHIRSEDELFSNPFTQVVHFRPTAYGRLLIIPDRFAENLRSLLWPRKLTILYPNWVPSHFFSTFVIVGLASLLLIIVFLLFARKHKMIVWGTLWFLLAVGPSCQIIPGIINRSDRFMYFPWAGLAPVIGYATYVFAKHSRAGMKIAIVSAAIILCALAFRTINQLATWRNTLTAFGHATKMNPASNVPHLLVGRILVEVSDVNDAIWHLKAAKRIDPKCRDTRFALGFALAKRGDNQEAIKNLEIGLKLYPYDAKAKALLTSLYETEGVPQKQTKFFDEQIVPLKADNFGDRAYYPFGVVWRDFVDWIKQKTTGKEPVQPAGATQGDAAIGAD